jgi:SAM-dependent methyltransferase
MLKRVWSIEENSTSVHCRICGAEGVEKAGDVEFYVGYNWPIYDCAACGCRFTRHDNAAYDLMYSEANSLYRRYTVQSESCKAFFDRRDLAGLRRELSQTSKYRFVLGEMDREPKSSRVLEIGASRGHLTSYFILAGCHITGVDVSPEAVGAAAKAFGDHFRVAGDPAIQAGAPYDVIFHVGTIGCVADPIGMTRSLLDLLKPGGRLLFNAPNRQGLALCGQLWIEGAPPPDMVTMFRPGFWSENFGDVAEVSEEIEIGAPMRNLLIGLRKLACGRWRQPIPIPLEESARRSKALPRWDDTIWTGFERVVRKFAPPFGLLRFTPRYPDEYGLFVRMKRPLQ